MKNLLFTLFFVATALLFVVDPIVTFAGGEAVELINPIGGTTSNPKGITSVEVIIGIVIKAALGIAGSLALVAFVYGSFVWLTSAGSSDKIQAGVKTMTYAAIGLFVIFAAYGILDSIIKTLTT